MEDSTDRPIVFQKIVPLMVRQVITSHIPHQRAPHGGSEPPDHRNRLKWVPSAWFPLLRASALGDKRTQRIPDDDAARGRRFSSSHDGYGCDFRTSPMTSPQTENASWALRHRIHTADRRSQLERRSEEVIADSSQLSLPNSRGTPVAPQIQVALNLVRRTEATHRGPLAPLH